MKRLKVMWVVLIFCLCIEGYSQGTTNSVLVETIRPRPIRVSFLKTTNLIFPYSIQSVDYGSSGIMVQKRKGVDNVLHVKAAKKDFEQTSLSVVTKDGAFYSFLVDYSGELEELNLFCDQDGQGVAHLDHNESQLEYSASEVRSASPFMNKKRNDDFSRIVLQGIFLTDQKLWLKLNLSNYSFVDFPVGYVKFFLKDKKRVKRQAIQEKEIIPICTQVPEVIDGKTSDQLIVGLEAFSIPKRQQLVVQIGERGGGRMLEIRIKPRTLLKARSI